MTTGPKPGVKTTPKSALNPVRVISVTSGKGGVGKTNITANLALALAQKGRRVLLWDADLGLANIDVLLGLKAEYNIHHLLRGDKTLREILLRGPGGIMIMPASSGTQELTHLAEEEKIRLLSELDELDETLDFMLIDTSAGISANVMYFNLAAQERIVVVSPEPTSITDAYALIKVMSTRYRIKKFSILPNMVKNAKEAKSVFSLLAAVADKHLASISLDYLGYLSRDEHLLQSVRQQKAVLEAYPEAEVSRQFIELANKVIKTPVEVTLDGNIQFFWKRLLKIQT
ncbi:MAG: MinD/ParA family protein [Pseudomonadota bacterium]